MNDQFLLMIKAALDDKGIKSDYNKLKQMFEKDPTKINTVLDMSATKTEINKFIKEYAPQLQQMFKDMGVKVNLKDIEASMKGVFVESEKALKQLQNAEKQAYQEDKARTAQKIADQKKLYLAQEEANKTEIANQRRQFLAEQEAYKTNQKYIDAVIAKKRELYLAEQEAYKINSNLSKQQNQSNFNLSNGKVQLDNNITNFLKSNSKLSADLRSELVGIQTQIKSVDATGLRNLNTQFKTVKSSAEALGRTGSTVFQKFKSDIGNFLTFITAGGAIMGSINTLRNIVEEVINIDSSMVSLRKVTNETDLTYKRFLSTAAQTAKQLGSSVTDVIDMTSEWAKLGYAIDEASELAKASAIYKNVGELSSSELAVANLVTAMKSYNITAKDAITIVDRLNQIENEYAVNSEDLGTGLANSASALALAGNSIDESLAMLTAMSEITQNASESGNAIKVLSMRLRGMKGELQEIGEEYENIESVSKIQTQIYNLTSGKVNIMDDLDPTKFKSTYEIMKGIASVYKDMSETDQAQLLEIIAGKQRGNSIAALLTSMSQAENVLETSMNSAGSALREQEKYSEGIQFSIDRLLGSLQELSGVSLNSSVVKFFIDMANGVVNATTAVGGLVPVLTTVGGIFALWKTGILPTLIGQIQMLILAQTGYTASTVSAALAQVGLTGAIKATATAMKSFLLTNPVGWALLATTAVISLVGVYNKLNVTLEEHQQKLSDLKSKYDSTTSEVKSLEEQLASIQKKMKDIESLKPIVFVEDEEYQKLSDSNVELERRLTIQKELQKIAGRDAENEAVATISNKSENSLTRTTLSNSNSGYESAMKITRSEAVQERIDAYNKLGEEIEKIEIKQFALAKAGKTESDAYKNLEKDLENINSKREEYYDYVVTTMNALDTESDSLVGATTNGKLYASSINSLGTTVDGFINSVNSATDSSDTLASDGLDKVTTSAEEATTAIKSFKDALADETLSKSIDDFQSAMKTIQSALSDTSSLSSSEILDLMQEFYKFDWAKFGVNGQKGVGDLTGALQALASQQYLTVTSTTGFNSSLAGIYKETIQASKSIDDTANSVINFSDSISKVEQSDEELYKAVVKNLSNTIKQQAEKYGIDFDNYKSLLEAKLALDKEYALRQQDLYNAEMNFKQAMYSGDVTRIKQLNDEWLKSKGALEDYSKLAGSFNTSLNTTAKDYGKKGNSGSGSKKVELPKGYVNDKADLEHRRNMGLSDKKYYAELQGLEDKYLKGHKEYQSEIWSIDEAIYKHNQDLKEQKKKDDEKDLEDSRKAEEKRIDNMLGVYDTALSKVDDYASKLDDGSDEQLTVYSRGIQTAAQKVKYLESEIKSLNTAYKNDKNNEYYIERLEDLQGELDKAKISVEDYKQSLIDSIQASQDNALDNLKNTFEAQNEALENQRDLYEEIINKQKESLNIEKAKHDYEKSISEKTEKITDIQSRMAELQKAANSGDRNAKAEYEKLQQDLSDAQDDLDETQYDHKIELQENALDKELDNYNTLIDKQLKDAKSVYDTKVTNITALFDKEKQLVDDMASYTSKQFATELGKVNVQLSSYGVSVSSGYTNSLKSSQSAIASVSSYGVGAIGSTSGVNNAAVKSLLMSGTSSTGNSDLNKYINQMYGSNLTYDEMVKLAKLLGVSGITSKDDVTSPENRTRILKALKAASFSTGGYVDASMIKSSNEDGIALVKHGEPILTVEQGKLFKELINNIKPLNNLVKLSTPNISNVVNNNSSAPITLAINVTGNPDAKVVGQIKSAGNDLLSQLANQIRQK